MTWLDRLLGLLDRALQVLVPPRPDRVAYISTPDYTDNAFYVFRHALRTRSELEHVWLVRDERLRGRIAADFRDVVADAGRRGHTLRIESRGTLRGYLAFLRSARVFHTHGAYRFRTWAWRRQVFCLWHGMPIKCIGRLNRVSPNPYPTFGTLHLATSTFFRGIIAAAFGVDEAVVRLCSLPRCDALQWPGAAHAPAEQVRARLGIPPDRRLVLWMPTYRAEGARARVARPRSFLDDLPAGTVEALAAAATAHGALVLTKLHMLDPLNGGALPWSDGPVRLMRAQEWAATGIQLYDLIAASDALVSDVSSVLIDYSITARPAGILGFDPATYTRELTFPFDRLLATGRFDMLADPPAIEAFFAAVARRESRARETFMYDRFTSPGAEQALRETGL